MPAFSPDGKTLLTTAGTFDAWNGRRLTTLRRASTNPPSQSEANPINAIVGEAGEAIHSATFSSDGTRVLMQGAYRLWVYNATLATLEGHEDAVDSAAFSPDGKLVLTRSYSDRTARIFDATTGKLLTLLTRERKELLSAVFGPAGMRVVTTSGETARIWDVSPYTGSPESLAKLVRQRVPYRMTIEGVVVPDSLVAEPK